MGESCQVDLTERVTPEQQLKEGECLQETKDSKVMGFYWFRHNLQSVGIRAEIQGRIKPFPKPAAMYPPSPTNKNSQFQHSLW